MKKRPAVKKRCARVEPAELRELLAMERHVLLTIERRVLAGKPPFPADRRMEALFKAALLRYRVSSSAGRKVPR